MKLLFDLNQEGTTIVMVTHSAECAKQADRIIYLLDGKIALENADKKTVTEK